MITTQKTIVKGNGEKQKMAPIVSNKKKRSNVYLVDTSVIVKKRISKLATKGLSGIILVPNAVMAELENMANKGKNEGFDGLEEITKLHKFKNLKINFIGPRPSEHQIKFAKSGEIDALIRGLAYNNKATLITSDVVQGKSAKAYNINVWFIKQRFVKEKKKFSFFKRKPKKRQIRV